MEAVNEALRVRRHEFTEVELERVYAVMDRPHTHPIDLFVDVLQAVYAPMLDKPWDEYGPGEINPTLFQIPREQSAEIVRRMVAKVEGSEAGEPRTSLLLEWMNIGPSTYEEE